ncbi:MAG: hypothetical protein WCG85_00500 [Polyangia bacterium]
MTAASIITLCASRGLRLSPAGDGVRVDGPKEARAELRETIREHKTELVSLLRAQRQAEVSTAYAEAFARLGNMYDGDLVGSLWARIVDQHPTLARAIDVADQAADLAALTYQSGGAADSSAFVACLASWERAWAEAIAAITSRACSDCGRTDATVMVTTDTGRFCRACLHPSPINSANRNGTTHV